MFDYCTFKLHDIDGKETLSFSGQTSIECMLCHYNISEHGMFIKGLRRLRSTKIYMILDDDFEFDPYGQEYSSTSLIITLNWCGAVSKITIEQSSRKGKTNKEIIIPKKVLNKWSVDNIKSDLKLNPQLFTHSTTFFRRLYYYLGFNYSQVRYFFKYGIRDRVKNIKWKIEHYMWKKNRKQ